MILVCPNCKASYLVPANIFLSGARKVRCARCSKDWMADLPSRMTAVASAAASASPPPPPPPQATPSAPAEPVPNLPAVWKAPKERLLKIAKYLALGLAVLAFLGVLALSARPAMRFFQQTFQSHEKEEPPPAPIVAPGFSMQHVRSERRYQDGSMQLVVDGELHFDGEAAMAVPDIHVDALGPDGKKVIEWTIKAPAKTMKSGSVVPFSSAINTPDGTIVEINLTFLPLPPPAS